MIHEAAPITVTPTHRETVARRGEETEETMNCSSSEALTFIRGNKAAALLDNSSHTIYTEVMGLNQIPDHYTVSPSCCPTKTRQQPPLAF